MDKTNSTLKNLGPCVLLKLPGSESSNSQRKNIRAKYPTSGVKIKVEKQLHCFFCGYSVKHLRSLVEHLRIHTKEEHFKCPLCKCRFKSYYHLEQHNRIIHKKETLTCPHCQKSCLTTQALRNHLKIHTQSEDTFQCEYCEKNLKYEAGLRRHVKSVHQKIRNHACAFCRKTFHEKNGLNSHMNGVHLGQKDLCKCPEPGCNHLIFTNRQAAKEHRIKFHPRVDELDRLRCKICCKIYSSTSVLRAHVKHVHGVNNPGYDCPLCENKYKANRNLQQHITQVHTAEKSYKCTKEGCTKEFAVRDHLRLHLEHHLDLELGRNYPCGKCPRVFIRKWSLSSHINNFHMGLRFPCYFCGFKMKKADHLLCHLRIHTGEKPYSCDKCGKEFTQSSERNTHKKANNSCSAINKLVKKH